MNGHWIRRSVRVRLLLSALGLTVLMALNGNPAARAEEAVADRSAIAAAGMDADKLALIPQRMEQFVKDGQAAGIVTLVARNGQIVLLSAVGEADIAAHRPMRPDSIFAIASMTKPITGAGLMILVDEGKVSLDDPVSKFIPEFKDAALESGRPMREITLRDVATHTAGVIGDQQNQGTLAETARMLAARKLGFEPGSKWQYSPGLSVAGRVIEVASGQPYEEFLSQRIFQPLGMKDTTFFPNEEQRARIVSLYEPGKEGGAKLAAAKHWINDLSAGRTANPSGGLFSTALDLDRFYQAVLNGGELNGRRIMSDKAVAAMTGMQTGDLVPGFTPGTAWGVGWCVVREPQGVTGMLSPGTYGHGGAFGTQGWVDPERRMIFVLLVQRTGFGSGDASDLRGEFQRLAVDAIHK